MRLVGGWVPSLHDTKGRGKEGHRQSTENELTLLFSTWWCLMDILFVHIKIIEDGYMFRPVVPNQTFLALNQIIRGTWLKTIE